MTDPASPPVPPAKPGKSTGTKVAIGCGIGCLGLIVLAIIAGILGWSWMMKYVEKFEAEFQEKGMKLQTKAQMVSVDTPPAAPAYYVGQVVKFHADSDVEVGILAQVAEIHGTMNEPVYFRGQVIQIKSGAHLKKGLDVKCQVIENQGGKIDGPISGSYQSGPPRNAPPSPTAPPAELVPTPAPAQ